MSQDESTSLTPPYRLQKMVRAFFRRFDIAARRPLSFLANVRPISWEFKHLPLIPAAIQKKLAVISFQSYTCQFELPSGRKVVVKLALPRNRVWKKNDIMHRLWHWLNVLDTMVPLGDGTGKRTCSRHLQVSFIFSPLRKRMPSRRGQSIQEEHANTAFTYSCITDNEIVLFREEEWYKVFVHETLHAFGVDFSHLEGNKPDVATACVKNLYRGIDPSTTELRVYEAYTETWAEFIHILLCVFWDHPRDGLMGEAMMDEVGHHLWQLKAWSAFQCVKVLDHFGMTYRQLLRGGEETSQTYRERHTSVFSYYVLKAVLVLEIDQFVAWCVRTNGTPDPRCIVFDGSMGNVRQFVRFLREVSHSDGVMAWFDRVDLSGASRDELATLRMCIC